MAIKSKWVKYGSEPEVGFFCYPEAAKGPLPAILVIQEAWGVDPHIEDVTQRFAGAGYAALAPDLFTKGGERLPLLTKERLAKVLSLMNGLPPTAWMDPKAREAALAKYSATEGTQVKETFDFMLSSLGDHARYIPKLLAATHWLRHEQALTKGEKIASVGFCMGGALSARLAGTDPELAGAVIFYGRSPEASLVPSIKCPILGHYGEQDEMVNGSIPEFEAAMKSAGKSFEKVFYQGVGHAFTNDGRPAYDARATRESFVKTLAFMNSVLTR